MTVIAALFVLSGCTTPRSGGVEIPTFTPRREALAYFPSTAPVVMLLRTDAQDQGVRRLAGSGALEPLERFADAAGLHYEQLRGLLGNDVAIGQPHVGGPPLAVLVTHDGPALDALAESRVIGNHAVPAGSYRGADLYAERRWAFAVRDRVLIAGRTTRQLLEALDTRVGDASFDPGQLSAVLPANGPPAPFVRAYVDLRPLVARAGVAARAVPVLRALGVAGISVGATPTEFQGVLAADTSDAGLTEADLPALAKARGRRPALPAFVPALAVADLAPLAVAAERAARAALPVTALRIDALRARLEAIGVALIPDLLHGPAAIVLARGGPQLRLMPERPALLEAALERAARRLRTPRLRVVRQDGLYTVIDRGRIVLRVGFANGALVAGRTSAQALKALATGPLAPLISPALARLPRVAEWYPRPVVLALAGTPDRLRLEAFSGFPGA